MKRKKLFQSVVERAGGQCEVCGSNQGIELHHILGGTGRRRQQERYETIVALCYECHRGTWGIHGKYGSQLDIKLKQELQDCYFSKGKDEDEVRRLMGGRLY